MAHHQVLTFEPDHRNFCCWSSGRDWQCLYSSLWIRTKGMEVMFLEELLGGWVRWNPSFPTGPLGEHAFFLLILPKLPFFYPVPSSLLLTCLCPTTGSFLPPAQSCCSVLTPLVTSALVSHLVSSSVSHPLCVTSPGSPAQSAWCSEALVQPALWFLSLPVVSGCVLLVSFLGSFASPQVLPSSFLREPHSEPSSEAIPASCQHIRSLALPGLSLQHCWLLVPAVASCLHFSSSLYPACLPLNTFSPQLQLPDFISGVSQSPCLSLRLSVLAYFSSPFLPRAGSGVCPPCAQIVRLLPLAGWARPAKSPGA